MKTGSFLNQHSPANALIISFEKEGVQVAPQVCKLLKEKCKSLPPQLVNLAPSELRAIIDRRSQLRHAIVNSVYSAIVAVN